MMILRPTLITFLVLLASATASAYDIEDVSMEESYAWVPTPGTLSLFCLPNGSGDVLAEAYVKGGSGGVPVRADARITLNVRTHDGSVLVGVPAEDMWLRWTDASGLYACPGGTIADGPTSADGDAVWAEPLGLGGSSESLVRVVVFGEALTSSAGIALHINSADINHDGRVDLADVGRFSVDYADPSVPYRSDFASDGVMNLADVGTMAAGVGAECQ